MALKFKSLSVAFCNKVTNSCKPQFRVKNLAQRSGMTLDWNEIEIFSIPAQNLLVKMKLNQFKDLSNPALTMQTKVIYQFKHLSKHSIISLGKPLNYTVSKKSINDTFIAS